MNEHIERLRETLAHHAGGVILGPCLLQELRSRLDALEAELDGDDICSCGHCGHEWDDRDSLIMCPGCLEVLSYG